MIPDSLTTLRLISTQMITSLFVILSSTRGTERQTYNNVDFICGSMRAWGLSLLPRYPSEMVVLYPISIARWGHSSPSDRWPLLGRNTMCGSNPHLTPLLSNLLFMVSSIWPQMLGELALADPRDRSRSSSSSWQYYIISFLHSTSNVRGDISSWLWYACISCIPNYRTIILAHFSPRSPFAISV